MTVHIVRLGDPRLKSEGLRIGTVRRPPRGVPRSDYSRRHFFDVWFPNLAPSESLLKSVTPRDEKSWKAFKRRFLKEMKAPEARRCLDLLAALSHQTDFSVGCYCEDESRCHRSLLRELLAERDADIA